ncbi:MAG: hypothetical protein WBD74_11375 [Candidatus Aquilonibacter sp.]
MKPTIAAFLAALTLLPLTAMAAPVTVAPKTLTLEIGGRVFAKVTASAASARRKATSTCYTSAGSSKDILKVTGINTQMGTKQSTYTMDVRAQRAGKCTITFTSDADSATVNVNVEEEKP